MASRKNVENARRFLWDDQDDQNKAKARGSTNLSGSTLFSTRDYAVDQSVNLMDMGDEPAKSAEIQGSGGFASSVVGLFRSSAGTSEVVPPKFHEYGDAAPSTESEEFISDKQRRVSPAWTAMMNGINSCVDSFAVGCGRLGAKGQMMLFLAILGSVLLVGGVLAALNKEPKATPRQVDIKNFIVEAGVTPMEVFEASRNNPQNLALKWITTVDPAQLEPDDAALLDRYALAVFYLGSNVETEGWKSSANWMSDQGLCNWKGVECVNLRQEATEENNWVSVTKSYDGNAQITAISLPSNGMKGTFPAEFAALPNFHTLDLSDNNLSGELPTVLGNMSSLRYLLLRKNAFVGTIPTELVQLTNLHDLHLGENRFEGTVPAGVDKMTELRAVAFSQNSFTGTLPEMGSVTKLSNLYLDDNNFSGTIPIWLRFLTDLKDIRLNNNKLTGSITSYFQDLRNVETVHLGNNQLTGTIPNMFDHLKRVSDFQLQNNQIDGKIPDTVTHLADLKILYLGNNKMEGRIPGNIGMLGDMEAITLNNNKLTGTIPSTFGNLDDIVRLSLNDNLLVGTIPTELGGCFRLVSIQLDTNKLTGGIPAELGKLDKLRDLRLEENDFFGVTMPPQICSLTEGDDLTHLSADCSSKVTCTCCSQCL